MKNTLINFRKELEAYGFPQFNETRADWILEEGFEGKTLVSNNIYDSEDRLSLNIKGISESYFAVEIAYSNQLMNPAKFKYLMDVMAVVNKYNDLFLNL